MQLPGVIQVSHNKYFRCDDSNELWDDYFTEVDKHLARLRYRHGSSIRRELESHVFEAVQVNSSATEIERLRQSLESLGAPADVVPPMAASVLTDTAQHSRNPFDLFRTATLRVGLRLIVTLRSTLAGVMLLASMTFILVALMKPFLFDQVGLFTDESGAISFGILMETASLQEHLGISVIPMALITGYALYWLSLSIRRNVR